MWFVAVALKWTVLVVSTGEVVVGAGVDERTHAVAWRCLVIAFVQWPLSNLLLLQALLPLELASVRINYLVRSAHDASLYE
jgi:hypothetical protein